MSPVGLPPIGSALLLGLVQGLTEFLPISSSGHLAGLQLIFPSIAYPGVTLELATHAGTTVAVLLYYRRLVAALALPGREPAADEDPLLGLSRLRWICLLAVGTLPTVLVGFLAREPIRASFDSPLAVAAGLALTGGVLMLSRMRGADDGRLDVRRALLVGLAQGVAIFPGVSRSGMTITAAILLRVPRRQAVTYSFLLSVPAIAGATLLDSVQLMGEPTGVGLLSNRLLFATLAAGFVGYPCIRLVHRAAESGWWYRFGWYCWLAASVLLVAAA